MTPELRRILNKIGWGTVEIQAPAYACSLEVRLSDFSHDDSARQAKRERKRVEKLIKSLLAFRDAVAGLNEQSRSFVDVSVCPLEERDRGIPQACRLAVESAFGIGPGIVDLADALDQSAQRVPRGRSKNAAAYRIADALAEIYVVGLGERPTKGSNDGFVSSDFGLICHEVYAALGVKISPSSLEPINAAIDGVDSERFQRLLLIRSGAAKRQKFSLFDLTAKGKLDCDS